MLLNVIGPEDAPVVLQVVREYSELPDLLSSLPTKYSSGCKRMSGSVIMNLDIAADTAYRIYNLPTVGLIILKVALKVAKLAGDEKYARNLKKP